MIHATIRYRVRFLGAGAVLPASGFGAGGIDRAVVRTAGPGGVPVPYVPGSHVRGVVREQVERLARLVLGEDAVRTASHGGDTMNPDPGDPVARLFVGGRRQAVVAFRDLVPADAEGARRNVRARARVSIDRRTGVQRGGRLFDHETWHAGVLEGTVEAWLDGEETADLDLALLAGGLRLVDALGGNRSAGLGRCEVEILEVKKGGEPVAPEDLLGRLGGRSQP